MAESMAGLKRSCRCAEVTEANVGQEMTLMGWVQKSRNKGGIIFTDLRDRSGIIQIIFEESDCGEESFSKAERLRSEFTVAVTGIVEKRSGAANPNLKTGTIEVRAKSLRILSESEVPPFPIEENSKTKEELRLKYRYLDLRRPDLQRNIMIRSRAATMVRQFLADEGFLEIETPTLIKSTPEGARGLSGSQPGSSGKLLRAAPVSPAFKAAVNVFRLRPVFSSWQDATGTRICGRTVSRSLPRSTWSFPLLIRRMCWTLTSA